MPELPEVETVKEALNCLILNKEIIKVDIFYSRLIQSPINDFETNILNKKIINIRRKGKYLIFDLTNDYSLIIHLRMEGKFNYYKIKEDNMRLPSTSLIFYFKDNSAICFDDTRKFGLFYLSKTSEVESIKMINKLGKDGNLLTIDDVSNLIKKFKKNKPIKALLLDQEIIAGIGNIYADEILFKSKINPLTKGKDLKDEEIKTIILNTPIILKKAIEEGGSTVHSFKSLGIDGKFQNSLMCYGKEGEKCPNCSTYFHKTFIGGRGTTYCPNCQINHNLKVLTGIVGRIGSGKTTALKYLKEKGYEVYSSDSIVHELYRTDKEMTRKLNKIYGFNFDINKKEDKEHLRNLFIENKEIKKKAEKIIYRKLEDYLINLINNRHDYDSIIIEVPLLFYAHLEFLFKRVIVIEVSKDKQINNLKSRGSKDPLNDITFNKDFFINERFDNLVIIENNSTLNNFKKKLDKLF